jgi:type I restriction enzyme M protein
MIESKNRLQLSLSNCINVLRGSFKLTQAREILLSLIYLRIVDFYSKLNTTSTFNSDLHVWAKSLPPLGNTFYIDDLIRFAYSVEYAQGPQISGALTNALKVFETNLHSKTSDEAIGYVIGSLWLLEMDDNERSASNLFQDSLRFLAEIAPSTGDHIAPKEIDELISSLVRLQDGEDIYDPTCGMGLTLATCVRSSSKKFSSYILGREENIAELKLAILNLNLQGANIDHVGAGVIASTNYTHKGFLKRKFDVVVGIPPWGKDARDFSILELSLRLRNDFGTLKKLSSDYNLILHAVDNLGPKGRAALVFPTGILFRTGDDLEIRKFLIEKNLIDSIILLPAKLFTHTTIQTVILLLRSNRNQKSVLFIDASKSPAVKGRAALSIDACRKIETTIFNRDTYDGYSTTIDIEILAQNDYDLSLKRYIGPTPRITDLNIAQISNDRTYSLDRMMELEASIKLNIDELSSLAGVDI